LYKGFKIESYILSVPKNASLFAIYLLISSLNIIYMSNDMTVFFSLILQKITCKLIAQSQVRLVYNLIDK